MLKTWASNAKGDDSPARPDEKELEPPVGYRPHLQEGYDGNQPDDKIEGEDNLDDDYSGAVHEEDIEEQGNAKHDPPVEDEKRNEENQALVIDLISSLGNTLQQQQDRMIELQASLRGIKKMLGCFSIIMVGVILLTGGLSIFFSLRRNQKIILVTKCVVEGSSLLGDGVCHDFEPHNTEECNWDKGDCIGREDPSSECPVQNDSLLGDGICHNFEPYNTKECGWDAGDCIEKEGPETGCIIEGDSLLGDGICHNFEPYYTEECGWDNGDCPTPECTVKDDPLLGDGICHNFEPYNTEVCAWDSGDCTEPEGPISADVGINFLAVANSGAFGAEDSVAGADEFNAYWARSPNQILHRKCLDCTSAFHKNIYYRRFDADGLPADFDLYDLILNNWFSDPETDHNTFGVDFKLYSTYGDALADRNEWLYCDFNDPGVGFPRNCGPNGKVPNQWNSFLERDGRRFDIGFYVETIDLQCDPLDGPHKTCSGFDTGRAEGVVFERKGACGVTGSFWRDCDNDENRNSCLEICETYARRTMREGCCSYRAHLVSDGYTANNDGSNGCFFYPGGEQTLIGNGNSDMYGSLCKADRKW